MTREETAALAQVLMDEYRQIPAGKAGEYEVKNTILPAGTKDTVVSMREAIFTGNPPTDIVLRKPYTVQELRGPDGVWMTNRPCELVQMHREFAQDVKGRVLIGGLGLGIVAKMAAARVKRVTVVELSKEVVKLVGPYMPSNVEVVQADLFDFIETIKPRQYATGILDIWQGTGEWVWQEQVVPLRRKIGEKIKNVIAWQEGVMRGQVWGRLMRGAEADPEPFREKSNCHLYAFRRGLEYLGVRKEGEYLPVDFKVLLEAEERNGKDEHLKSAARMFLCAVGTKFWENIFGRHWDEAWAVKRAKHKEPAVTVCSDTAGCMTL